MSHIVFPVPEPLTILSFLKENSINLVQACTYVCPIFLYLVYNVFCFQDGIILYTPHKETTQKVCTIMHDTEQDRADLKYELQQMKE